MSFIGLHWLSITNQHPHAESQHVVDGGRVSRLLVADQQAREPTSNTKYCTINWKSAVG